MTKETIEVVIRRKRVWRANDLRDLFVSDGWLLQNRKGSRSPHQKLGKPGTSLTVEIPFGRGEISREVRHTILQALMGQDQPPD